MELKPYLVLPSNFSLDSWISYFDKASSVFAEKIDHLPKLNDVNFSEITALGYLSFSDATNCGIYLIKVNRPLTDRTARKKQFDKAIEIIKQKQIQAGLFIFYDEDKSFRFSFIYPVYKGTKRAYSNYRRHSFYINADLPNKTYQLQLSKYKLDSLVEIKEMFSVERISDLFYQEFEQEYAKLQKGIKHLYNQDITAEQKGDFFSSFCSSYNFSGFCAKKGLAGK